MGNMRASEIKAKYKMDGQPAILSQFFYDMVDFTIQNYRGFCYAGKDENIGLTADEIKAKYKMDGQPQALTQGFYEVIDFVIDNYDGFSGLSFDNVDEESKISKQI